MAARRDAEFEAAMVMILDAAERRAMELINEALKYERLATADERVYGTGQQAVADETLRVHYRPLRDALDLVRLELRRGVALALIRDGERGL
jgi:hypothetical protein